MTRTTASPKFKSWLVWLAIIGLLALMILTRLTALNRYIIVDEADRWRWAEEFVLALNDGDMAATLVGDGYPGIVPVWAESVWVLGEAGRRSLAEGQWIGDAGLYNLFHQWDRTEYLAQQRLPIVLLNTALALAITALVWRLFGGRVALLAGLLIALDPFYLSDSRVNRAEAVITGLMTLSVLWLIFYARTGRYRYALLSGIFGGLSFLTKIQALVMLPALGVIGLLIYARNARSSGALWPPRREHVLPVIWLGVVWTAAAVATWLLLWPAMWVTPLKTLALVYAYTTRKVGAEGVNLFFMGQTYSDTDPGVSFYPVVFFMRVTPLALLGLAAAALFPWLWRKQGSAPPDRPNSHGSGILLTYVLAYTLAMTFGSHKQDRYLLPVFLALDILAALGLVFAWVWLKDWWGARSQGRKVSEAQDEHATRNTQFLLGAVLLTVIIGIQLIAVLPHHPYYYSYFNPLAGGGTTAAQTLRIGWGEGMDQAGAYLAAKPNAAELVVSSRFTHNMLGFPGKLISLGADDRWTKADYIVLYIQQVQRRLDPSPEFLDYFQNHRSPEKVITLGGIDYVWIYPRPFQVAANPQVSVMPDLAALLGYSWEPGKSTNEQIDIEPQIRRFENSSIRLFWKNLGLGDDWQIVARLVGPDGQTEVAACQTDPAFTAQARAPGAFVESVCTFAEKSLPAGLYTVEFGLRQTAAGSVNPFLFPESWRATRITAAGSIELTPEQERLDALVSESIAANAQRVNRAYGEQIRLAAVQLEPPRPQPGDTLTVTFYWQIGRELTNSINLTVQLSDSRAISLGRDDVPLFQQGIDTWSPGWVTSTQHTFTLPPELDSPLAGRIEVSLANEAKVALPPTTLTGEPLDDVVNRFTIAPPRWPTVGEIEPVYARWENGIELSGYKLPEASPQPGDSPVVTLVWRTNRPITDDLVVFVHLVDEAGQLRAQNDAVPRAGAYPTQWWQPGNTIEDMHPLTLPPDLPPGDYSLLVGLYRSADGTRLPLESGGDTAPLAEIILP